jgi:hypothetical protein
VLQSRCLCIPANPPYLSKSQILEGSEVRFASSASQHDCESSEARVRCGKPLRSAASPSSGPTKVLSEATSGRDYA